jgi:hypothetical protein
VRPLNHPPSSPPSPLPSPPSRAPLLPPTVVPVDFVCTRDGRARRFVHVAVARLVGTGFAAGVSPLLAAPPTGFGTIPSQK